MDELDSAIVAALQSDGRRSNRDLAQMLGVAPSTTLERVRALQARGVITGIHASADTAKMGRPGCVRSPARSCRASGIS